MNAFCAGPAGPPPIKSLSLPYGRGDVLCAQTQTDQDAGPTGSYSFRGRRLMVRTPADGQVLFPTDVGLSLLEAIQDDTTLPPAGARLVDIGTGCGIHTLALLSAGAASATAIDINPACGETVRANAELNGLPGHQLQTLHAALADLEPGGGWDLVVCNPPHFPDDPSYATGDGLHTALIAGHDGRGLYDELLDRLDDLLAPGGTLLLAHSSLTDIPRSRANLLARGYQVKTLQICELDIPMRSFAGHRDRLLARLYRLRAEGRAAFTGLRFEVHTLAVTRPTTEGSTR